MVSAIDKFTGKFLDNSGLRKWLDRHLLDVMRYLDSRYAEECDKVENFIKFCKDPYLGYILVQDTLYSNDDKINKFMKFINENSFVCPVVGRKGGGKTSVVLWIFEQLHKRYPEMPLYWLDVTAKLPKWITVVTSWDEIPNDAVVAVEEAAIQYFARDAMTKESKDLSKMLFISRHRGLRIFFNYQTLMGADVNIHRLADAFLIKPFQMIELADLQDSRSRRFFKYVSMMSPTNNTQALLTLGDEWIRFSHPLPTFWSESVSKSYKKMTLLDVVDELVIMDTRGLDAKQMSKNLKPRGYDFTIADIQLILDDPEGFKKEVKKAQNQ